MNFDKPIAFGPDVDRNTEAEKKYLKGQLRNQLMRHVAGGGALGGGLLGAAAIQGANIGGKGIALGALLGAGAGALTGRSRAFTDKTKEQVRRDLASRLKVKFKNKEDFIKWRLAALNSGRHVIRRPDGKDYTFVNTGGGRHGSFATVPFDKPETLAKVQAAADEGGDAAVQRLYAEMRQGKTKKASDSMKTLVSNTSIRRNTMDNNNNNNEVIGAFQEAGRSLAKTAGQGAAFLAGMAPGWTGALGAPLAAEEGKRGRTFLGRIGGGIGGGLTGLAAAKAMKGNLKAKLLAGIGGSMVGGGIGAALAHGENRTKAEKIKRLKEQLAAQSA